MRILTATRRGACPFCHTFIGIGGRIVRLDSPVIPLSDDFGESNSRTKGWYYADGHRIPMHPRQYAHWRCVVEMIAENHPCVYCGSEDDITIDHVIPRRFGGSDEPKNLVPACRSCNSRKGTLPVEVFGKSGREVTAWLKNKGWTPIGSTQGSWRSPDPRDKAFFSRAMAIRAAAFAGVTLDTLVPSSKRHNRPPDQPRLL